MKHRRFVNGFDWTNNVRIFPEREKGSSVFLQYFIFRRRGDFIEKIYIKQKNKKYLSDYHSTKYFCP